jgi:fibronectin type III domain protein
MVTSNIVTGKSLSVLLVAGLAILSVHCGGDGGSGVTAPTDPSIGLSETNKSFSATAGSGDPAAQTVAISNAGDGTLSGLAATIAYGAGQPTGWLSATLSASTAPSTLTLTPTTGSLTAGTYNASVAVTSAPANNSPQAVSVTFTVSSAPVPLIGLSTTASSFSATTGGPDPEAQTVSVTNGGAGTLSGLAVNVAYGVGEPTGWLSASLSQTTAPSTLTLTATTGSLTEGTYTASIAVTSAAASNSPQFLDVTFTVMLPPPTNLTATAVSSSRIDLTWTDNASTEDGYKIERCAGASCTDFTHFTTVGRNGTSYPDAALSAGTSYSYRVRGSNDAGNSAYSNTASATTLTASEGSSTFFASFDNMVINNTSDPNTADRVSPSAELDVGSKYFYRTGGDYTALQYASLMKFDVQSVIAGKTILEATLSLYQFVLPADFDGQFKLAAIQTSWDPSTISWKTWSDMGEPYPDGHLDFAALQPVETPLEFDVTGIVQKWADGTLENNGFQIWEPSPVPPGHDSNQALEIQSLEVFRGEGTRPQLFIHYR